MHIWVNMKPWKVLSIETLPEVGECYKTELGYIRKCDARVMDTTPKWNILSD